MGAAVVLAVLVAGSIASAQTPVGPEFQVSAGALHSTNASVASDAAGNFVVVWQRVDAAYIVGRRYDRFGNPQGTQFSVNQTPLDGTSFDPAIAMAPDGEFVVVWLDVVPPFTEYDIFGRRFAAGGQPIGGEFQINTYTTGRQLAPNVSLHPVTKDIVVIWRGVDGPNNSEGVFAQRFDAANARVGAEFLVNTLNTNGQQIPGGVDHAPGGDFVIAWADWGNGTAINSAHAQRYAANGSPVGASFVIGTTPTTGHKRSPRPTYAPDGTILFAFEDGDGLDTGIAVRRFSAGGVPVGNQLQVNTYTTASQRSPWLAMDSSGNYVVQWWDLGGDGSASAVRARFFSSADAPVTGELLVNTFTTNDQVTPYSAPSVASDAAGNVVIVWHSDHQTLGNRWIRGQRFAAAFDAVGLEVDAPGNGVFEPGETTELKPTWRNNSAPAAALTGTLSAFDGPPGAAYLIADGTADYGVVPGQTTASCVDCYAITVSSSGSRPAFDWDAIATETTSTPGIAKEWRLHIGGTFADVSPASPFYRSIETLVHHDVTVGCSPSAQRIDGYCPDRRISRAEAAVFLLRAKDGPSYAPPPCAPPGMFRDVSPTNPFCPWIEELVRRGAISGCAPGRYCPKLDVAREDGALFVLRTLNPALAPPACVPPNLYADVPETSPRCPWIEELTRRGGTTGCGGGNYCPTDPVTREQIAPFITATFSLTLYGP